MPAGSPSAQLSSHFLKGMHWAGLSNLGKSIHSHTGLFKFKNIYATHVLLWYILRMICAISAESFVNSSPLENTWMPHFTMALIRVSAQVPYMYKLHFLFI